MLVKCRWCDIKDTDRNDMMVEKVGKVNKYYHNNCWNSYQEHKKFLNKEKEEKDKLNECLLKIFRANEIPSQAWYMLERLRGGNPVFKEQKTGKRYKEGYKYSLIQEAFEYCEDTIHYWLRVKNFEGFMQAFRYSMSIIIDKIYYVEQKVKEREEKKRLVDSYVKSEKPEQLYESNYKKPTKSKNDITDFLDD